MREWKVSFDGNFRKSKGRAGKELVLEKRFAWAGRQWRIPAAYSCGRGLVVDFCMQADTGQLRSFLDKWELTGKNEAERSFSEEEETELERENPLCCDFCPQVTVNGKELQFAHGCGVSYNPLAEGAPKDEDVGEVMEHYGLDSACGWMIWRYAFLWKSRCRPEIRTISLTMRQQPLSVPGPHFRTAAAGDCIEFVYPENGPRYTLTVQEYESQTMPEAALASKGWEYPRYFQAMSYTVSPKLPEGVLTLRDCARGDQPIKSGGTGAAAVSVIGGADGPTTIFMGADGRGRVKTAVSSLRFAPVKEVEWRLVFQEKHVEDICVSLL